MLLDALGTLVALDPPAPRLRMELAERFGLELSDDEARQAISAEIAYYRAHLDEGRDPSALSALRARCAEAMRAALPSSRLRDRIPGVELTEALLAALHFTAFDDVPGALRRWRSAGVRIVVVSNWDASLPEVLERLGLLPFLDGVLTSAQVGARKPSPAIFERALEVAHVPASRAVHIGDSINEDVAGARAAGIEPVLISRGGNPPGSGVHTITSLDEWDPVGP